MIGWVAMDGMDGWFYGVLMDDGMDGWMDLHVIEGMKWMGGFRMDDMQMTRWIWMHRWMDGYNIKSEGKWMMREIEH